MPVLTDVQSYSAELMRKLVCARHEQVHWLIGRKYPDVSPEKVMRQLRYLNRVMNDGRHYIWPGCEINPARVIAVEIMLQLSGGCIPIFDIAPLPCALVFHILKLDQLLAFRVYIPEEGMEAECRAIAENQREPLGHAAVFYIQDRRQIPFLPVSHPHIFAVDDDAGGIAFQDAKL